MKMLKVISLLLFICISTVLFSGCTVVARSIAGVGATTAGIVISVFFKESIENAVETALGTNKNNKSPTADEPRVYIEQHNTYVVDPNSIPINDKPSNASSNNVVPASNNSSSQSLTSFVDEKNQINSEIASLAVDINAYVKNHKNLKGANSLLNRADSLKDRIQTVQSKLSSANISNTAAKSKLMVVIDFELQRTQGLIDGINDSMSGGSYKDGFLRGHNAANRFREADAELNKLIK